MCSFVDGDSELETAIHRAAHEQDGREQNGVPHLPVVVLLVRPLGDAPLDDAVVEHVEPDLLVRLGDRGERVGLGLAERLRLLPLLPDAPVAVQPLEMHRVERVLHALQPVAGELSRADVAPAVLPLERLPAREQRRRLRAEVGKHEAAKLLDWVRRDAHLLLEATVRMHRLLEGLLDALAGLVVQPTVVHAPQAVLLRDSVRQVDATVGAEPVDQPQRAAAVLVQHEVLAEDPDGLGGPSLGRGAELRRRRDGVPVAAEQVAHGRRHDAGEPFILSGAQHVVLPRTSPDGGIVPGARAKGNACQPRCCGVGARLSR